MHNRTLRPTLVVAILALTLAGGAAAQNDAPLRCQRVADAAARLACYDAAFPPIAALVAPAAPAAVPAATVATPATPAAPAAPTAARSPNPQDFGLAPKVKDADSQSIETTVAADFDGWSPGERIKLQNGQVWQVVDGSTGSMAPKVRKVTVRRTLLGAYLLEFEGLSRSPRVQRVQ